MAKRGKPSTAHVYDNLNQCLYCHMYKSNVELLNHVCTPAREVIMDRLDALAELKTEELQVQNG